MDRFGDESDNFNFSIHYTRPKGTCHPDFSFIFTQFRCNSVSLCHFFDVFGIALLWLKTSVGCRRGSITLSYSLFVFTIFNIPLVPEIAIPRKEAMTSSGIKNSFFLF